MTSTPSSLTLRDGTFVRYEATAVRALNGLKPQRVPDGGIYIGRRFTMGGWRLEASPYANPFRVGENTGERSEAYTLEDSLQRYYDWLTASPALLGRLVQDLDGRVLYCFCHRVTKSGAPSREAHLCHGDVLVAVIQRLKAEATATADSSSLCICSPSSANTCVSEAETHSPSESTQTGGAFGHTLKRS